MYIPNLTTRKPTRTSTSLFCSGEGWLMFESWRWMVWVLPAFTAPDSLGLLCTRFGKRTAFPSFFFVNFWTPRRLKYFFSLVLTWTFAFYSAIVFCSFVVCRFLSSAPSHQHFCWWRSPRVLRWIKSPSEMGPSISTEGFFFTVFTVFVFFQRFHSIVGNVGWWCDFKVPFRCKFLSFC